MLLICYGFLVLGAACACMIALRWLGMAWRRLSVICLVAAAVSSLTVCLPIDLGQAHLLCVLFLLIFLPVVLVQPGGSSMDAVAASSIACAGYGMFQLTVGTVVRLEIVSLFFRFMLILLLVAAALFFCQLMWRRFPGENWQESFPAETASGEMIPPIRGFLCLLAVYGISCFLPVAAGCYSLPVLILEWFGFFGGLALLGLLISCGKEKQTIESEKQYRDEMQSYMSVIRSQRHDYNFHVQTLHGLLLRKDYEACERYLNELIKDSIAVNHLLPLADAAISALILSFQSKALQSGIHMEISIENDLSQIATNVYETNKVIGNLLQNALDETEGLTDKSYGIRLSILKRGEFCLINVSNRVERSNPMEAYQAGHSRKKGHEGIGIASIRALTARYDGTVYSRMEDDIIFFVAKIPLRIGKEVL